MNKLKEAGNKLVVIDFFAVWCGPCKMIGPLIDELSKVRFYINLLLNFMDLLYMNLMDLKLKLNAQIFFYIGTAGCCFS